MADSFTPKLNLTKPEVGASTDTWGSKINTDLDTIDGLFDTGPVLKVAKGGTGAATAAAARTNLDVPGISTTNTFTQGQIISVTDNTNAALRVTQLGTGNALLIEDNTNPDSTPTVIDASGRVVIGHTASINGPSATAGLLQIVGAAGYQHTQWSASTNPYATFARSRSATVGTHTIVQSGDTIGAVNFAGSDGYNFIPVASIEAAVDGTPGVTDMPGRIVFSTTADGASTATERLRIGSAGQIGIGGANYGTSGQVLVSGGATAAPSWGGTTSYVVTAAAANTGTSYEKKDITSFTKLEVLLSSLSHDAGSNRTFQIQVSVDNGANYSTALTISDGVGSGAAISGSVAIHNANASGAATRLINIVTGPQGSAGNAFISTSSTASLSGPINAIKIILSGTGNLDGSGAVTIVGYR